MKRPLVLLFGWCALVGAMLLAGLGSYALIDPDEGRTAEVAREMLAKGDYAAPHLNGEVRLDKPAFYFGVVAQSMRLFGQNELAVRLPSVLFTIATVFILGLFGLAHFQGVRGLVPAIVLSASPLVITFGRTAILDSSLLFFFTASALSFFLAMDRSSRSWALLGWIACGLAVMTKGPVGLLPLAAALVHAFRERRVRTLLSLPGLLAFLSIQFVWLAAVMKKDPTFLSYAIRTETMQRMTSNHLDRAEPFWYFLPIVVLSMLPWIADALSSLRRNAPVQGTSDGALSRYCVLWSAIPLVVFSLSLSKRPQYILPIMPALAILAAITIMREERGARRAAITIGVLGLLLVISAAALPYAPPATRGFALPVLLMGAILAASAWIATRLRSPVSMAVIALAVLSFPLVFLGQTRTIAEERSARQLGTIVRSGDTMLGLRLYSPSMSFYSGRSYPVYTDDGRELGNYVRARYGSGASHESLRPAASLRHDLRGMKQAFVFIPYSHPESLREVTSAGCTEVSIHHRFRLFHCGMGDVPAVTGPPSTLALQRGKGSESPH